MLTTLGNWNRLIEASFAYKKKMKMSRFFAF